MSARRITQFRCDECGETELSPDNYSLPEGWEHHNPAGEQSFHLCVNCVQRDAMKNLTAQAQELDLGY